MSAAIRCEREAADTRARLAEARYDAQQGDLGIPSYQQNIFPQGAIDPILILSFQIEVSGNR
jgi:hypothetical protein